MPDAFAGCGVQREQGVGEQIVAHAIRAIEIKGGRARRRVDDAARGIESHAGPVVRGAAGFPRVGGPGVVAEFAGARNGVEGPAKLAGAHIVGADVAWRSGQSFGIASADDDQVFVDDARAGQTSPLPFGTASQVSPQIYPSSLS